MKFTISILLVLIVFTYTGFSQPRSYIGLSIGPAIPVGEFAKTDNTDDKAGLARLGAWANLEYVHQFRGSDFGFVASLRARWNPINSQAALGSLKEANPNFQWQANKASWQSAALMAGVYRDFHFIKKLSVKTGIQLGAAEVVLPAFNVTGVGNSLAYPGKQDALFATSNKRYSTTLSGAFQAEVSGRISKRFYWLAHGDFWFTGPTFKNVKETIIYAQGLVVPGVLTPGNASSISINEFTQNYTQPANSINLAIGIGMGL